MLSSKVISLITFLVVIIAVVLSVTSAPLASPAPLSPEEVNDNVTVLQSDSIPVSSDGGDIKIYNEDDAKKIDDDIIEDGNEAQGDGKGLKL